IYVVQSYFNLMVHAKLQEVSGKIFERNRMLAYADALRGEYTEDSERINKDAAERTKKEIENEGFEKYSILETVIKTLNELEKDQVIEISNKSTLRQSIVIIWSAIESLIRDIIRVKLNTNKELAVAFLDSSETAPYWQKKQISFEHLKSHDFDLSGRLGDIALEMNSCSNLSAMKTAISFVFGNESLSFLSLKSGEFYKLYKLRNVIAHRNGIVDEKYKSEVACVEDIGQTVNVTPELFSFCFKSAKELAMRMLQEISNNSIHPNANASAD
ncbi:MAG: hypothetical protein HUJ13_00440, partial [Hydrogenovibrio crunogenus]|nr:hypothetical protein [Hydrogenovibrio crunogenus]